MTSLVSLILRSLFHEKKFPYLKRFAWNSKLAEAFGIIICNHHHYSFLSGHELKVTIK